MPHEPLNHPLQISLVDDEVVFLGDGAVNFSMTPEAARITLRHLASELGRFAGGAAVRARARVILLVEDEPLIREVGATILNDAGYVVIEATGARDALAALEGGVEVHVLFTDIQMPGELDGLALAHMVNDRWPSISLLLCSGHYRPEQHSLPPKGRFLPKPYAMNEMLRQIEEIATV